jgi:hypothetical protein
MSLMRGVEKYWSGFAYAISRLGCMKELRLALGGGKSIIRPSQRQTHPAIPRVALTAVNFLRAFAAVDQEQHGHADGNTIGHLLQD